MTNPVNPYSVLIAQGALAPNTNSQTYTVPAGYVYVIRDISTRQTGGSGVNTYLRVTGATPAIAASVDAPSGASGGHWVGHLVLPSGTTFEISTQVAGNNYWVSGYQLVVD